MKQLLYIESIIVLLIIYYTKLLEIITQLLIRNIQEQVK